MKYCHLKITTGCPLSKLYVPVKLHTSIFTRTSRANLQNSVQMSTLNPIKYDTRDISMCILYP